MTNKIKRSISKYTPMLEIVLARDFLNLQQFLIPIVSGNILDNLTLNEN